MVSKIVSYPPKSSIESRKSKISSSNFSTSIISIAIEGLGRIKSTKAIEPLIERLNDESWFVKTSAIKALSEIGGKRVFNTFIENLVDNEGYINEDIVEALCSGEDLRAVDALIQALNQYGYNNKIVEALGKLGDPRAVQPIIRNLTYSPEDMPSAAYALVKLGDKGIEAIFKIINEGGYPFEVEPAAEVLSEIKDIKYLDTIIEFLSYENNRVPNYVIEKVRRCAIDALGNFDDPRVFEILMEAIKDGDLIIKWIAVEALGKKKDPRFIKPIIEVLYDGTQGSKKYALKALLQFDKETVVDTLIEMLKSKSARVREETVKILGEIKALKALGTLEDLYETEQEGKVLFAIDQVLKYFQ